MTQRFFNNLRTTLTAPLQPDATLLPIPSGIVVLGEGEWCWLTLQANINGSTVIEVVKATAVAGAIHVERGQQGTASNALAFPVGTPVQNRLTAVDMEGILQAIGSKAENFNTLVVQPLT